MFSIRKIITISDYVTMLNIITGLLAILLNSFSLIYLSIIFDSLDGYVARKTNTVSDFGAELDSISDVVSFGVAPAYLLYHNFESNLALLSAIIFCLCGALRLARFGILNVKGFIGLPIPAGALLLSGFCQLIDSYLINSILAILIGLLMISDIKYPKYPKKIFIYLFAVSLGLAIAGIPHFALLLCLIYAIYGIIKYFKRWLSIKKEILKKIPENILNKEAINKLENKGVEIIDVLGKGHRGVVLKGIYNNKEVAIKIPRTDSPKNTIENEAKILKLLEKYDMAPKVYEFEEDYLIMEFIDGEELKSAVDKLDKDRLLKVVEDILKITLKLDILGIEHKEIQGGRHFLITDKKTYIIDFDKAKEKKTTKNFTGAVALLFGEGKIAKTIREKLNIGIDEIKFIREFAKTYKKL